MQDRPGAEALLRELRALFRERGAERLPTAAIVAALGARLGRPISAHRETPCPAAWRQRDGCSISR
jgi:hypothetical protein